MLLAHALPNSPAMFCNPSSFWIFCSRETALQSAFFKIQGVQASYLLSLSNLILIDLVIHFRIGSYVTLVSVIPVPMLLVALPSMSRVESSLDFFPLLCSVILSGIFPAPLYRILIVCTTLFLVAGAIRRSTSIAYSAQSIFRSLVSVKEFMCGRMQPFAFSALSHAFRGLLWLGVFFCILGMSAFSTGVTQSLRAFTNVKKIMCRWFVLIADTAILLRYTAIHDKANSFSSRQRMFQHRAGTTLLPHHYTIHQPVEQLHGLFDVPFLRPQ
jgi:hypothetical protein